MEKFVGRKKELCALNEFADTQGAGFTYVRGRRRIGKSWLLREFQKKRESCFYFSGAADETGRLAIRRFAEAWELFSGKSGLTELRTEALTWSKIFKEIEEHATDSSKGVLLLFDEIQWLAKKGSGFVGLLKEAWVNWERLGKIKIVICGSSSRFFNEKGRGDEMILRGLKTRASIIVRPFTLSEVQKYYFQDWSEEEICLTYMMFGGIPYYLDQFQARNGFIHAVNHAAFTEGSIFPEEVDEVLRLEFNRRGIGTVKKILSSVGQTGTSWQTLQKKTGLPQSSLTETLERLVDYGILFKKLPANTKPVKNESGYRYFMKDFFLNFYFQILEPLEMKIKGNRKGLLFPAACIDSDKGFYISNFSGKAFELLVRHSLEGLENRNTLIRKRLLLSDENYTVETFWSNNTEVDLIVENSLDRISRILECKWLSQKVDSSAPYISEILSKSYRPPKGFSVRHYIVLSQSCSENFNSLARNKNVEIISLSDLF